MWNIVELCPKERSDNVIPISLTGRYDKSFNQTIFLDKCPHILVGGTTGSGKSYLMKSMLCDILECEEDVRILVIDPKSVDYQFLKGRNIC